MSLTASQLEAVQARGHVVVVAGAGTGKTRTLVERAVQRLLDPASELSLDEILMVTFTEAAAAEMRQRIRQRLEDELRDQPQNLKLTEQIALLDTAQISTLHSFCLQLVRQHFFELGQDPQLTVLADDQAQLLASEVLDEILADHYASSAPESKAVLALLQSHSRGWEKPARDLVRALHQYTQTRSDPERWISEQLSSFQQGDPGHWQRWLLEGFTEWRALWLPVLRLEAADSSIAAACGAVLEATLQQKADPSQLMLFSTPTTPTAADTQLIIKDPKRARQKIADALGALRDIRANRPKGKGGSIDALKLFFKEVDFLHSVAALNGSRDPLTEDWNWIRPHMITLLSLTRQFTDAFAAAKLEAGQVDFHDLEQLALRLLWDPRKNQPTELACRWRAQFKEVFIDEYQDINAAQDRILTALTAPPLEGHRFMVGDVKQSIYRFRQAEPGIFQAYAAQVRPGTFDSAAIHLSDNFRSRESVLNFVNLLFASIMRRELGGVDYDHKARLRFGDPNQRKAQLGTDADEGHPRVHVLLRVREKAEIAPVEETAEDEIGLAEMTDTEKEARMVGKRLLTLQQSGYEIWDLDQACRRPITWSDMVILLRSPKFKVESYAKEFARLGIPLQAKRTGFFDNSEVSDLLNLLSILDNPLQDVPVLAVLRSPLVGLTVDELASVRLAQRKASFWIALQFWHRQHGSTTRSASSASAARGAGASTVTLSKVEQFLDQFRRWRDMSRHATLAQRLEAILTETHYLDWLLTQPRGAQRQANVQQLLSLARNYDESQSQGLYRFLRFIEAQRAATGDREPAPLETEQAVRLMSIHQSKGLEFPLIVVGDLGKRFNFSEKTGGILFDERFGLCPQVRPPESGQSYPSLPQWLAVQRQRREILGEELRILYVALTRAQDTLLLAGSASRSTVENWPKKGDPIPTTYQLLRGNSYLDWLGPWLTNQIGNPMWTSHSTGTGTNWAWQIYQDNDLALPEPVEAPSASATEVQPQLEQQLCDRILWRYPFASATQEPAKTSVTAIRQQIAEQEESTPARFAQRWPRGDQTGALDAASVGTAHHRFLQLINLQKVNTLAAIQEEAIRLGQAKIFTEDELKVLNREGVFRFWSSAVGRRMLTQLPSIKRELEFTLKVAPCDLEMVGLRPMAGLGADEFVVAQGTVDLAVLLPDQIWVLDFKTDRLTENELPARTALYAPQINLYAHALSTIYHRPVTERWLHYFALGRTEAVRAGPVNLEG